MNAYARSATLALVASSVALGCTTSTKTTGTPPANTNQTTNADSEKVAPAPDPPAQPIAGDQRACAVAAAAPEAAPGKDVVGEVEADLEAMLRPHKDKAERFERLKGNWNVEADMSVVLTLDARVSARGVRVDGVARDITDVAEVLTRIQTHEWSEGKVWLLATHPTSSGETDAQSFTIFAGGYPDVANPHAALDLESCAPGTAAGEIGDVTFTNLTIRAWDGDAFTAHDDPVFRVTTSPRKRKTRSQTGDRLARYRAFAHRRTRSLTEIGQLEQLRNDGVLFACGAKVVKGSKGFKFAEGVLRLEGVTEAPTCEGVESSKDGEDVVLRLNIEVAAPESTPDFDTMDEATLLSELERLEVRFLIAREKIPHSFMFDRLLYRLDRQMTKDAAKLTRIEAVSLLPIDELYATRLRLEASGPPEAILQSLWHVTQMNRLSTIRAAQFDLAAGESATIEFETYFYFKE